MWNSVVMGAIASFVSRGIQERNAKQKERETHLDAELVKATHVFEKLSVAASGRLFLMRKLREWTKAQLPEAELKPQWEEYRRLLFAWNSELNLNLVRVEQYFGRSVRDILEHHDPLANIDLLEPAEASARPSAASSGTGRGITFQFGTLSSMLVAYGRTKKVPDDDWPAREAALWADLAKLNQSMMICIQQREVGAFNPEVAEALRVQRRTRAVLRRR